jgi:hypothetical protein
MAKTIPDHHDAELLLRVYDLRREAVLRESRRSILRDFWPKSWEDVQAVLKGDHPVYSFVRHGIVHPEFWLENNGEGLYLFGKVEPWLPQLREAAGPVVLRNAEWVARECPDGRSVYERIKVRLAKLAAAATPR